MLKYGLVILGLAGFILFFPFNFGNSHSCLAHKYLTSKTPGCCNEHHVHGSSNRTTEVERIAQENHHLLSHYLYPFAFLWWGSIGLIVLQIRNLRIKKLFRIGNRGSTK